MYVPLETAPYPVGSHSAAPAQTALLQGENQSRGVTEYSDFYNIQTPMTFRPL